MRAAINVQYLYGLTPLFIACAKGFDSIVTSLVKAGADLSIQPLTQKTPHFESLLIPHSVKRQRWTFTAQSFPGKNGSDTVKTVAAASLCTDMVPPCASTISFAMASPSPAPPVFVAREASSR